MQVIVTHDMTDFDGFAAAVAAQKLYPKAVIVLGRRLGAGLREFLALHRDRFPSIRYSELDQCTVRRMVIVDVRRSSRLKMFSELVRRAKDRDPMLEICIYDHHAAASDDLTGSVEVIEPVGSATTLLVEQIRERGIALDTIDRTLFLLGIHADTGSLCHQGATGRDARAVGWLLDQGATLGVVRRYLKPAFTEAQRMVLVRLLEAVRTDTINGLSIGFATVPLRRAVSGLADVTSEAIELEGLAALIALYPIADGRVQIVGRALSAQVDVGATLEAVGGGGHAAAAAATVRGEPAELEQRIAVALQAHAERPARVFELMSSPVHTVRADLPLRQLGESLAIWRHTGVPVMRDGKIVGIISRRDVQRAERDGRIDLPVGSCMTQNVKTIGWTASIREALELMESADVGRLPVLREGRLVGIVSRTDALKVLYEGKRTIA